MFYVLLLNCCCSQLFNRTRKRLQCHFLFTLGIIKDQFLIVEVEYRIKMESELILEFFAEYIYYTGCGEYLVHKLSFRGGKLTLPSFQHHKHFMLSFIAEVWYTQWYHRWPRLMPFGITSKENKSKFSFNCRNKLYFTDSTSWPFFCILSPNFVLGWGITDKELPAISCVWPGFQSQVS